MTAKDDWDLHKLAGQFAKTVWQSMRDWDYFTQDKVGREMAKVADGMLGTDTAPDPCRAATADSSAPASGSATGTDH
ncbi:MAG: hypothetical protein HC910_05505, partial [Spirulinaceae cyanobacterium SM2_1_0]|nr:hypothetical protein [Spirulinaceae cyanobacterium SM2_1_0]